MYFRFMIAFLFPITMLHISLMAQLSTEPVGDYSASASVKAEFQDDSSENQNSTDLDGDETVPYYVEGSVIDLEKLLEADPELREKYDSLTKDERKAFVESLDAFNEAFHRAFQSLLF